MPSDADEPNGTGPAGSKAESAQGIRRRELLVGGSAIAGAAVITRLERDASFFERLARGASNPPSFTSAMLRPDDMLAFNLEFYNATLETDKTGFAFARPGTRRPEFFMVAVFGPQAVAEEPLTATGSVVTNFSPPFPSQLGGPSRLAFAVRGILPLDDESILDWVTLKTQPPNPRARGGTDPQNKRMLLVPSARTSKERSKPSPQKPTPTETAIEAPFRMVLSPALDGAGEQFWRNRANPLVDDGRTELWHTRLVNLYCLDGLCSVTNASRNGDQRPESEIRAVWTPGWKNNPPPQPFDRAMTLTPQNRSEIVSLSSDFSNRSVSPATGKARLLTLSALGSSFDFRFDFPNTNGFGVTHWGDRGTLGREHYVKVVQRGFLYPFGHEAVLLDISERQIDVRQGNAYAVVRVRRYLIVKEKTKSYSSFDFPFSSVSIVDEVTPIIDQPDWKEIPGFGSREVVFWPRVGGRDYLWTLAATDVEGIRVEFQAPLIWVSNAAVGTKSVLDMTGYYNKDARSKRPFGGQSIAYAKSAQGKARQTAFPTEELQLGAVFQSKGESPKFAPKMQAASIKNPALGGLGAAGGARARGALGPEALLRVKPADVYVKEGFNQAANEAQAYLTLAEKVALDYTKDAGAAATGALGAPNMDVSGLSRTLGPIGGDLANGTLPKLKPADFLNGAKFLGINFVDVLEKEIDFPDPGLAAGAYAEAAKKVPKTLTQTIYEGGTGQLARRIPKEIRTEFSWEPELRGNGVFIARGPGNPPPKATMLLRNVTVVPITAEGPGTPRQDTTGELKNFGLSLFGEPGSSSAFLILYFNRFEFRSRNDQKPSVNVDIKDVVFAGPLTFVNDLRNLMSSLSGGSGLAIDITPGGVVASYGLDFPTITTGVLTIADISLGAAIEVPFDGRPVTTRFNFCEPKRPFLLTYTIFGGGGYANVAINSKGVESLTVSLEFGAATAINLGVASGSVQVMAGIVIKVESSSAVLTGFVRLRGELDVLGIISVSLEFNLSLSYDTARKEAWGRATLSIEVEVFCFSKRVSITVEKKFSADAAPLRTQNGEQKALGGGSGAPSPISFADLYSETAWDTYRAAFAGAAF